MVVRPYKRKTCRSKIDENEVASAVSDVLEGRLSIRRAADKYSLHAATLQRRIKKKKAFLESNQQFTCSKFGEGSGESTHPPVSRPNAVTGAGIQQQNFVNIKEEPAEGELELGPVAFQHMDCNYRPYKEEPPLD